MTFEIAMAATVIQNEIAQGCTQVQVAQTYALALRSSDQTDWRTANDAIIGKWGVKGLDRIKRMAWKAVETGVFPGTAAQVRP
jgi:hypothetical protein